MYLSSVRPTDDRSHVIERSLNRRTGQEERKQDFINLDESEFYFYVISFWYSTAVANHSSNWVII